MKDAFHQYVVNGNKAAVNPEMTGTKAFFHYVLQTGESKTVYV